MATLLRTKPMPLFGVEVDRDLREPMTDAEVGELVGLFKEHDLLVFKNQDLNREQQERVLSYFSPVLQEEIPYVSNATPDAGLGTGAIQFHSDMAFVEQPYRALSLHALEATKGDSSTRFVNVAKIYDSLPADLQKRLAPLHCINWVADDFSKRTLTRENPLMPKAEHPLVKEDPTTGKKVIYASYLETVGIPELSAEESEALLNELFDYLYKPENVHEHVWEEGDCLYWNNMTLQHARGDVSRSPRILQRATGGTATIHEQRPGHGPENQPYAVKRAELVR